MGGGWEVDLRFWRSWSDGFGFGGYSGVDSIEGGVFDVCEVCER